MPRQELQYPKQSLNTVKRLNERANYELETIHRLINEARIVNVSFNDPDSPFPVSLPMIGVMGSFDRPSSDIGDVLDLYLHGYVSSRIVNLTRKTGTSHGSSSSSSPESKNEPQPSEPEDGLPMTIQTSTVTGLLLALTPSKHSYNFTSATLFGHATLVESIPEKLYAMELITNKIIPTRWSDSRTPPTQAEMTSTSIMRVKIQTGSAKIYSGGPTDDRHDLENEELKRRVWTGVVPVYTTLGEPIAGGYNVVEEAPGYLRDFIGEQNGEGKRYAEEAARVTKAGKLLD